MKTNTNTISMNIAEICENRNALDKLEGVKLRHPDKALNGEKFVDKVIMSELNLVMTRIRAVVNGIAPKNVGYDEDGELTITPRGRHKKSCLRWKTPMPIGYRTLELRWVDRLIEELVCNHQLKVVGYKTPTTDAPHSEDEWAYMNIMTLCDKVHTYSRAISDDKVRKNLRLEVAIRSMAYENSDKLIAAFNELIQLVDAKGCFDELTLTTLMRAVMIATTGSIKYPKEFTDKECLEKWHSTRFNTEMLLAIGKAISKNGECLPYKAFKDANPRITSKMYGGNTHPYVAEALYGLGYLAFIMDDKHITKLTKYVSE